MADPTQANRSALASLIPSGTPLGKSISSQRMKEEEQLAADEANNLVMQRDPIALPEEALNVVNPEIPEPQIDATQMQVSKPIQGPSIASVAGGGSNLIAPNTSKMEAIVNQQSEGADQLIAEADKFHAKQEEDARNKITRTEEAIAKTKKVVDEDYQKVKDFKFDDRSVWSKASTGQKIGLMLGAFFSSLSPDSAKAFRDGVQSSVDRDIDAQKADLATKKDKLGASQSELGKLTARLDGNVDAASDILKARIYHGIAMKADIQAKTANSKLVVENAKAAQSAAYNAAILHQEQAAAKMAVKSEKSTIPGYNGVISDPTERRNFTEAAAVVPEMRKQLDTLRRITAQNGKSFSPTARAEASSAVGTLISKYKTFEKLGTLDAGVERVFEKLVQDPTSFFTLDKSSLAKINSFDRSLTSGLESKAKALGISKQNSEIGRLK